MSKWIKVEIETTSEGIEPVAAVLLNMGLGYEVQDSGDFESFLEGKEAYWDYVDDDLMELKDKATTVTVYLSDKEQGVNQLAEITRELDRLKFLADDNEWGILSYKLSGVEEEDWATAWKQYYKPVSITNRLTICPQWQEYNKKDDEVVVLMDPGMAFGTGTHESTKLCLEFLDEIIKGGEKVLDVGCGSGILSIAAILLGAKSGVGSDIDQVAAEVAQKNAENNDVSNNLIYRQGSFADGITDKFEIVFANIVADAIIKFSNDVPSLLAENGSFICSGIIDERAEEVKLELEKAGLKIKAEKEEKGWVAYLCKLA